jgi:hypothetical protein
MKVAASRVRARPHQSKIVGNEMKAAGSGSKRPGTNMTVPGAERPDITWAVLVTKRSAGSSVPEYFLIALNNSTFDTLDHMQQSQRAVCTEKWIGAAALACLISLSGLAQEPPHDGRYFERQAIAAYRAGNHAAYLENLQKANELRPNHPRILYNLSGAFALNAKPAEATAALNRVAAMGLDYPPEKDDDFASIKDSAEFKSIVAKFAENRKPVGAGQTAFTIPQTGLIAEGIAYDPADKSYYVGSVHQRKIIRIDSKGAARDLATVDDGLWGVFGMKVDAARRILWVCTSTIGQMSGYDAEKDKNQATLLAIDLRGKAPIKRYPLADRSQPHVFGDLAIASNGDVYVSDSGKPAIFILRQGGRQLEPFTTSDKFGNLQGLVFGPEGRQLFVADYSNGVFSVELSTKAVTLMAPPPNATLLGLDGIYYSGNSLIAIQNGVAPQRVLRLNLDRGGKSFSSWQVIEANQPQHDDITLGVVIDSALFYIANGQWNAFDDDGKQNPKAKLSNVVVIRLPL